jgi:hypothetical protein
MLFFMSIPFFRASDSFCARFTRILGIYDYRSSDDRSFDGINKDHQPNGDGHESVLQQGDWITGSFFGS